MSYPGPTYPPSPFPPVVPDHPKAMTILVLGMVSLSCFGVTGPFAWYLGGKARREIRASQGQLGGMTMVTVGWAAGIAGCVTFVFAALALAADIIFVLGPLGS